MQLKISNKTGGNRSFQFLIVVLSFFNVAQCQRQQTHQYNPNSFNQQTNNAIGDTDYEYQDLPPATAAPTAKYSGPIGSSSNKHRQSVVASASNSQKVTPPVAILKQINRHNEDGSYTYGFEGADGSFKIETKSAQGEVTGKYGYVDDSGKVRVVEYGANKYGFRPSGEGITVPPPVIINEADAKYEEDGEEEEVGHRHAPPPPPPRKSQQQQPQQASLFQAAASKQRKQQNHHGYVPATTGVNRPPAQIATGYDDNVSPNIFRQENGQQSFAGGGNFNAPSPAYNYQNKIPKRLELPTDEEIGDNFAPPSSQLPTAAFQHSNHQSRGQQQSPLPAGNRPSFGNAYPAPVIESQPDLYSPLAAASSRASHGRRQESGGVLEQLLKQYSLPPNGSPAIHDTSYGIY